MLYLWNSEKVQWNSKFLLHSTFTFFQQMSAGMLLFGALCSYNSSYHNQRVLVIAAIICSSYELFPLVYLPIMNMQMK